MQCKKSGPNILNCFVDVAASRRQFRPERCEDHAFTNAASRDKYRPVLALFLGGHSLRILSLACAIGLTATLSACDQKPKDNQTVTINGNGGNLTISGNGQHFTMKANDGKSTFEVNGSGMSPNVDMPAFAPLYPGAKVTASMAAASKDGKGGMVAFQTSSPAADVVAFYKQKAMAYGMNDNLDSSTGGTLMFVASAKEGKQSLQVVASGASSGSTAQVTWGGN